jgi:hypothetical protein
MSNNLVVNPYLQFQRITEDNSAFHLIAPKPGEGLQTVLISKLEHENIFEVFNDLSSTRFDFLDADKDLNDDERNFLLENGVLVREETKPEKPLFYCGLEDVPEYEGEIIGNELVVNPGFSFEPLTLANFASLSQKNLSPFTSIAWITSPITNIQSGWWIAKEYSEVISRLKAGEYMSEAISESLLRKLAAAEIIGTKERFNETSRCWIQTVSAAREKFATDKYTVIPNLFPPEQMSALRRYYRRYVSQGFMPFGDPQVERRYRQHNEPFASFIHGQLANLMSMIVSEPVKLSYVYAASYKDGSILTPHTDREQCEFSVSFQVDYEPEPPRHLSPWAIYVEPIPETMEPTEGGFAFTWGQLELERKAPPKAIRLASGDGLIYKGRELVHYRDRLPSGHRSTSLFFHFVAADFQGNLD